MADDLSGAVVGMDLSGEEVRLACPVTPDQVEELLRRMGQPGQAEVARAELRALDPEQAAMALLEIAGGTGSSGLRSSALYSLSEIQPASMQTLKVLGQIASDEDANIRRVAVTMLTALSACPAGRAVALAPMTESISDPDPRVREAAARGIGRLALVSCPVESPSIHDALAAAASDSDPSVAQAARRFQRELELRTPGR